MAVSGATQHVHACSERARTLAIQSHGAYGVTEDANPMLRARQQPIRLPCRHEKHARPRHSHRPLWRRAARLAARGGCLNHFPAGWHPPAPANGQGHGVGFSTCRSLRGFLARFDGSSSPSLGRMPAARPQGLPRAATDRFGSARTQLDC